MYDLYVAKCKVQVLRSAFCHYDLINIYGKIIINKYKWSFHACVCALISTWVSAAPVRVYVTLTAAAPGTQSSHQATLHRICRHCKRGMHLHRLLHQAQWQPQHCITQASLYSKCNHSAQSLRMAWRCNTQSCKTEDRGTARWGPQEWITNLCRQ